MTKSYEGENYMDEENHSYWNGVNGIDIIRR